MTDYLQLLIERRKTQMPGSSHRLNRQKLEECPSVSCVSTPSSVSENSMELDQPEIDPAQAFQFLLELHARQFINLDRGIARVSLHDWRIATGMDEWEFWQVVKSLERDGRITREHGYARPR